VRDQVLRRRIAEADFQRRDLDAMAAARLGEIEVNVALDWCARIPAAG